MNVLSESEAPDRQSIADWYRLFSDERFHRLSKREYSDHNFIREHCRLGFESFVHNEVDQALLQLYSKAAESRTIAVVGAPFTPCHWGTLAVLLHLFRGNHDLRAKRTVYWLTTERHERALFARLRMHGRFRRVSEALAFCSSLEYYDDKAPGTSLVFLQGTHELSKVPEGQSVVVSDGRGELVFRKGEADDLIRQMCATGSLATLIIPSRSIPFGLATHAICWPWSEVVLANYRIPERFDASALPWKWELGAHFAGDTTRRIMKITGVKAVEDLLVELKHMAYRLFSKPKTFYDTRLMMDFQRIVGGFRQMAIPLDAHEAGDDPGRLSARLACLEQDTSGASGDIADELRIGLMYVRDLVRQLQYTPAKWDLLRSCVDECIETGRTLGLAFPQKYVFAASRTVDYIRNYAAEKGVDLGPRIIAGPDDLPHFRGEAVMLAVPKFAHASQWRIPFDGRLTILAWEFDHVLGDIAMKESNPSAESVRRRTWASHFSTSLQTTSEIDVERTGVEEASESSKVVDVDGEIEAFDPSYRGAASRSAVVLTDAVRARAGYVLSLDDGSTLEALAGEEQHVLLKAYGSNIVKMKKTANMREGDDIILVNGESYDQLTKRLQMEVDRISSLLSFSELWERWQFLCLLCDETDTARETFIRKLQQEFGCKRGRGTILSWLRLQRMGPEIYEDIVLAALAAGDFELAQNAKSLWEGLNDRRSRHRKLGKWLMKALAHSAGADHAQRDKIVDDNLGLTFGDLQRGISVRRITHIQRPIEGRSENE